MRIARLLLVLPISLLAFAACGDDDTSNKVTPGGMDAGNTETGSNIDAGDTEPAGPFATPSIPCADSADSVYGAPDPGGLIAGDANRGKILKCAPGTNLTKAQIQAELTRVGFTDAPTSGARVFKVLYQTTRGDAAHSAAMDVATMAVCRCMIMASPWVAATQSAIGNPSTRAAERQNRALRHLAAAISGTRSRDSPGDPPPAGSVMSATPASTQAT